MEQVVTKPVRKQRDILDLAKYILSFFIVALHTFFLDDYLYPWLRLAVPLFFLISAYLLAEKLKETPKEDHWKVTWKYIKRNLYLYLFWMLVLLPIIVYLRLDWWDGNVGMFIWRIFSNSLFGSPCPPLWFIVASMFGALMMFVTQKIHRAFSFPIILIFLAITVFFSSYSFVLEGNSTLVDIKDYWILIFTRPQHSFPTAIVFMLSGQLVSRYNIEITKKWQYILVGILTIGALVGLYFEWDYLSVYNGNKTFVTSVVILPASVLLFILIKDIHLKLKYASWMRKMSTIVYTTNYTTASMFTYFFTLFNHGMSSLEVSIPVFLLTVLVCHGAGILIFYLEKKKHLGFLKYSH